MIPKITELTETRYRTVRERDASGNRIAKQVAYTANREVNVVTGGKRFAHAFVDGIVYYVIYFFIEYLWLNMAYSDQDPVNAIASGFVITLVLMFAFPVYYIVFEHFFQKTPGKFLTKSLVIDVYGNKPEIGTNILRNIIRLVPFEAFSCLGKRGWHDTWSDTYVVSEEEYAKIKALQTKMSEGTFEFEENESKPLHSVLTKRIMVYGVVPLCVLLYFGIIFKTCTDARDSILSLKNIQHKKGSSAENDEIDEIANIYNNGQVDEAQERLLKFTSKHKDYYLAWTFLGHTYLDQGKYEEAIEAYTNGIKANKASYAPYNGLGMVYMNQEEYDKAMSALKKADSLEPKNSAVIANLAALYDDMGNVKKAVELGEQSLSLDTTNPTVYANLAIYYFKNEQPDKSKQMYAKSVAHQYEGIPELCDQIFPDEDADGYISVSGTIIDGANDEGLENAKIEVLNSDSVLIRKVYTNEVGKYFCSLPIEFPENYIIKVSNPNYIHKFFKLSTENVPVGEWKAKAMNIATEIILTEKVDGVDYSFLNKPLNRYYYDVKVNKFVYDEKLLSHSLKLLNEMKEKENKIEGRK